MTITLYDESSTAWVPTHKLEASAAKLRAWFIDRTGGPDELTMRTTYFCRIATINTAIPASGPVLEMVVILDHFGWRVTFADIVPHAAGAYLEWKHQGQLVVDEGETHGDEFKALDVIAEYLQGDALVSDSDSDYTGRRYGHGAPQPLVGELAWARTFDVETAAQFIVELLVDPHLGPFRGDADVVGQRRGVVHPLRAEGDQRRDARRRSGVAPRARRRAAGSHGRTAR